MKSKKKVTQIDIDKQNNKLFALEHRLQYLINEHVALKEKFNKIMKEYKDSCDILQIKENEKDKIPQYKKDYTKTKELEKQKHDLIFKLETFKNEHLSIKQTLEEYENKKKKLQSKYDRLKTENNELKNREEEIDYYINERKIEKKGLEDFLDEKIKEEIKLRSFFEDEYKKLKEAKKNYNPPKKNFDLTINPGNSNNTHNNINNNINNNLFDFHNLSNVKSNEDENLSMSKKNDNNDFSINKEQNKDNNNKYNNKNNKNSNIEDKKEDENLINSINNMDIKKEKTKKNYESKNEDNKKEFAFNHSNSSISHSVNLSLQSSDSENSD